MLRSLQWLSDHGSSEKQRCGSLEPDEQPHHPSPATDHRLENPQQWPRCLSLCNLQSDVKRIPSRAYHKVGSNCWMVLLHGSYFKDVLFTCDQVYAIDASWNIFICNIYNETTVMVTKVTTVNAPMNIDHLYLVEVDCHLWVALRYKFSESENFGVKKGAFKFATILMVSPMTVAIEEVTDLEGKAFFFGLNQSFWMSTEEHTQLKKNCVYYTNFPLKRVDDVYGHQDFGIYDIVKRKIERVPGCPFEYPFTRATSAWLMPHLNIQ
ncbi:hypothetical protein J5N97_016191 [Dioscorea zingiberensis]|uniref:KIB1-4 beta-propeller domain-containing protein n=1 Tax=Dioscorea zingiberensis TaxID=325984 RepID=A0A9D5CIX2_9LILI|nr:hypothetical protein J5N97_016191 [Dioscorea zingiberensis]